jgi:endonuclease YncB( thermonuclease family)
MFSRTTNFVAAAFAGWVPAVAMALMLAVATALMLAVATAGGVSGSETLAGPVPARVLGVIDGDTVVVRARVWLGQDIEIRVRLDGVDTPEIKGRCPRERALALKARALVAGMLEGRTITLTEIHYGKFAGRVVARVATESGEDLTRILLKAGLARPYRGGRRLSWC